MQRLNGLHQIAAQLAVTPFRVARAPIVRIHELHQIQIERGAFAGVNGDTQLAVIGVQSGYVGVEPVPAVTADDDGTIRRIRTDRTPESCALAPSSCLRPVSSVSSSGSESTIYDNRVILVSGRPYLSTTPTDSSARP